MIAIFRCDGNDGDSNDDDEAFFYFAFSHDNRFSNPPIATEPPVTPVTVGTSNSLG